MGEGDFVLGTDLIADDHLADVIELVPILIKCVHIRAMEWLEFGSTRNSHVQSLGREKRLLVAAVLPRRKEGRTHA